MNEHNAVKNTMEYLQDKSYGVLIDRTMRKIKQDLEVRLKDNNICVSVDEFVILDRLEPKKEMNPRELAELTFKDGPTITRLCDKLFSKELIVRELDLTDRRKVKIKITPKGEKVLSKATPIVLENRRIGWKGLNQKDYKELIRVMETIYANYL